MKIQLQALMARSLVFQPGPAFGKTTSAKDFGYAKVSVPVSPELSRVIVLSSGFIFTDESLAVCLPAFISAGGGK